jgi:hypothetical protein
MRYNARWSEAPGFDTCLTEAKRVRQSVAKKAMKSMAPHSCLTASLRVRQKAQAQGGCLTASLPLKGGVSEATPSEAPGW